MSYEDKPPLDQALAHFGVKGMKWGVRKQATVAGIGVGAGALIVGATPVGALAVGGTTAYVVARKVRQQQREKGAQFTAEMKSSGALNHPVAELRKT